MKDILLITGGSRGIGAATALLAAKRGHQVAVNFNKHKRRADLIVEQICQSGANAIAIQGDVSNETDVIAMFDQIDREMGVITALVNSAGVLPPLSQVKDYDVERLRRIFEVNVFGTVLCAREAVKRMSVKRGGNGGAIVNISSGAARLGAPNDYVDYAASKAAIDTFTIGLAKETAVDGIRVNAVRPGFIDTEMHESVGGKKRFQQVKHTIAMGRVGQPEEIAESILWLLSDKASYCTGTIVDATGGR